MTPLQHGPVPNRQVVVFLGPSLERAEAQSLLPAEYRPPLRRGDLDTITAPAPVVIIDGVLEPEARLLPNEALHALERGVHLFGAASTGALLAADPSIPGVVVGIGRVFHMLCQGHAKAEDVVLLYAAHDFRTFTVPVVDVLCWLEDKVASGCIPTAAAASALSRVRALPLEERTPEAVTRLLRCQLGALAAQAGSSLPSAKAADARQVLGFVRTYLAQAA